MVGSHKKKKVLGNFGVATQKKTAKLRISTAVSICTGQYLPKQERLITGVNHY